MKEMTFKAGDFVWTPGSGFCTLESYGESYVRDPKGFLYHKDGRHFHANFRTILTPEEAGRLGLIAPKRQVQKTLQVWMVVEADEAQTVHYWSRSEKAASKYFETMKKRGTIGAVVPFTSTYEVEQ